MKDFSATGVPEGYLLTFRTYGSWLHGDPRGSQSRARSTYGTPVLPPNAAWQRAERARMTGPTLHLGVADRQIVERTVAEVCRHRRWRLYAVSARTEHVHVVLTAPGRPERILEALKAWCTRRLREAARAEREAVIWSRHGSTRYLWDHKSLEEAAAYVRYGQD
jgi:REP element-mobilizing transposase RayT